MADLTKLGYYSQTNFLKRDDGLSGGTVLSITTAQAFNSITINHNLGYIPFYTYAAELSGSGIIWSTQVTRRNLQSAAGSDELQMFSYATTTTLTLGITNTDPPKNASIDIYYVIYLDYGGA